jgi:hypothetical protein
MLRIIAVFLLQAMTFAALCRGDYLKGSSDSQGFSFYLQKLPPNFLSGPDNPRISYGSTEATEVPQYDAAKFFKDSGVPFPAGTFAIYDEQSSVVVIRNTQENLDLVDILTGGCGISTFGGVDLEISTYECTLPPMSTDNFSRPLDFSDLARLPGDAIRLLDQVTVLTKSGIAINLYRTLTGQTVRESSSAPLEKLREFTPTEFGTIISGESVVAPDPRIIDIQISYKFRMPPQANWTPEFEFNCSFNSWANRPIVIYSAPIANSGGKTLVVAATTRLISYSFDGAIPEAELDAYSR